MEQLTSESTSAASEAAAKAHSLTLSLAEMERNRDTYKTASEHAEKKAQEMQTRVSDVEGSLASARAAASAAAAAADERIAAAEKAASEAEARAAEGGGGGAAASAAASTSTALGPVSAGAAAHGLLSANIPDAITIDDVSSLTKAALYSKYVDAMRERSAAIAERDEASETLNGLLSELTAKAPRIQEMRQQLIEMSRSHQEMALRLDASASEGASLTTRNEALQSAYDAKESALKSCEKELADRTLQLQLTLEREQKLQHLASTGGTLGGGTPGRRTSINNLPPPPSFGIMGGVTSPFGVSASPALLPPGSSTAGGAGPSDQPLRTPDDVIAAHLVPFRDIAEMQQKNAQLVRTVRALSQAHEAEIAQKENESETAIANALAEVASLREASARQQASLEQLTTQRDLYKSLKSPPRGGGGSALVSASAPAATSASDGMDVDGGASAAEIAALREELTALKDGTAQAEAELVSQLERARESEKQARLRQAELEAQGTIYQARVEAMEKLAASGGTDLTEARQQVSELTGKHVELQGLLKSRSEELLAAQSEAKRHGSLLEVMKQEKELLVAAKDQMGAQLEAASKSNAALQQTMSQMSEAHDGWRKSEADGTKRLQSENETLRREWVEVKATLGRERDRAADAKRESELQLNMANEATEAKAAEVVKGREENARLEGQLGTMRQLHDTLAIQLREMQEQRGAASVPTTMLTSAGSGAGRSTPGSSVTAEELAAARRTISNLEKAIEAEKAHGLQYKALAEAAEKEKEDQLKLSAEVKSNADNQLKAVSAAKQKVEEEKAASQRATAARAEEIDGLRSQLTEAKRAAEASAQEARDAVTEGEAKSASAVAEVAALKVKLAASEEEAERSAGKYRTELMHHSEDMQLLAAAKEAAAEGAKGREVAEANLAEMTAALETSQASFEERSATLASQISQLEERVSNGARENALLHSQVQRLTEQSSAAGGEGGGGGDGDAGGGGGESAELLTLVRRDKTLLTQKNELLTLELSRLKQTHESVTRQLALSQAKVTELTKSGFGRLW